MSAVPEDVSIPLRACEPWCEEGDGHPEDHPDDRCCRTDAPNFAMTTMPVVAWGRGEWGFDAISVTARRRPEAQHPEIIIAYEGTDARNAGCELRFTIEEAEALSQRLACLVDRLTGDHAVTTNSTA